MRIVQCNGDEVSPNGNIISCWTCFAPPQMFNRDEPEREKRVYVTVKASDMGRFVSTSLWLKIVFFSYKNCCTQASPGRCLHHWSQHQGLYKVLLKLHISVKIKTSKKWTFVSQDINDNAPIFDRANYDVPVAQVNYFARWHHLILHHNYQRPPSWWLVIK